jgi:hypothetical protein
MSDWSYDLALKEARLLSREDLRRHASVSRDNKHRCRDCYTCACLEVLEEREERDRTKCLDCGLLHEPRQYPAQVTEVMRAAYRAGAYSMPIPPVQGAWNEDDWCRWIDAHGIWKDDNR